MSGVVLRCRTCGTTQEHSGDCDACSAGAVEYFCGNHSPGRWLDGPVCDSCGARYGEASPPPPVPASRTSASIPRAGSRRSTSTSSSAPPSITGVRRLPPTAAPPVPGRVSYPDEEPDTPSLSELLVEMAEEGRRARGAPADAPLRLPTAPVTRLPIVGCLFRLFMLLMFLGLLAVAAVFMLVNGAF